MDNCNVVVQIRDSMIAEIIIVLGKDVARAPVNSIYKPLPAKSIIVMLNGTDLHLKLKKKKR